MYDTTSCVVSERQSLHVLWCVGHLPRQVQMVWDPSLDMYPALSKHPVELPLHVGGSGCAGCAGCARDQALEPAHIDLMAWCSSASNGHNVFRF